MELLSTRRYSPSDDSKIVDRELLSSESTHPADPQVAKSSLDDRRSASSDTFGEEQSALTTSMGGLRSKPTRKAGRPRLDGPGEAVLPEVNSHLSLPTKRQDGLTAKTGSANSGTAGSKNL